MQNSFTEHLEQFLLVFFSFFLLESLKNFSYLSVVVVVVPELRSQTKIENKKGRIKVNFQQTSVFIFFYSLDCASAQNFIKMQVDTEYKFNNALYEAIKLSAEQIIKSILT